MIFHFVKVYMSILCHNSFLADFNICSDIKQNCLKVSNVGKDLTVTDQQSSLSSLDQDGRRGAIHTVIASVVCPLLCLAGS